MGWIGKGLGGLAVATGALAIALASWEPYFAEQPGPPPPARVYQAEVIRDKWGVPQIIAKTDADVAFGTACIAMAACHWAKSCALVRR